jgi:hypothetical protein
LCRYNFHIVLINLAKIALITLIIVFISDFKVDAELRKLVIVDDRMMDAIWLRYFVNLFNTKPLLFSLWMVVLVCIYSGLLTGLLELLEFCCQRISRIIRRKES